MHKLKSALILSLLLLLCVPQAASAAISGLTPPVHFSDTQWNLLSASGYTSIETDILVESQSGTDGYYFANTVYFTNYTGSNFGGAYAGFQTNGFNGSSWIGKMALFSVWDVSSGIAAPGGTGTTFGGEGTGFSVRIPYNWQVGTTYRLKIYIDQDATSNDRLWGASLTNLQNNQTTLIGRIYVPVSRGLIRGPVTFHERYTGATNSCSDINASQVLFSNTTANNGSIKATSWNTYYRPTIPDCQNLYWTQDIAGGYRSAVGIAKPTAPSAPIKNQAPPKEEAIPAQPVEPPAADPLTPETPPPSEEMAEPTAPSQTIESSTSKWPAILVIASCAMVFIGFAVTLFMRYKKIHFQTISRSFHDFDFHGPKNHG